MTSFERFKLLIVLCLLACLCTISVRGYSQTSSGNSQVATSSSSASKTTSAKAPSASDIAAAKTNGKVWVNLGTGIYHKGGRWYGKTKNGKFMTVDEAKKAGYKPSKRD